MSETEERLQRHVRAMGAMNRQLQAQLEGGGGAPWGTPSSQGGDLLATAGTAAFGTSAAGARRAATAGGWLEQLAIGHRRCHAVSRASEERQGVSRSRADTAGRFDRVSSPPRWKRSSALRARSRTASSIVGPTAFRSRCSKAPRGRHSSSWAADGSRCVGCPSPIP